MMSGNIQDWQISASSTTPTDWDSGCHERFARLYLDKARSWCADYKAPSEWLQIDLGVASKVSSPTLTTMLCCSRHLCLLHMASSVKPEVHYLHVYCVVGREEPINTQKFGRVVFEIREEVDTNIHVHCSRIAQVKINCSERTSN